MRTGGWNRGLAACAVGLVVAAAGCVDRRFVVETNVPGALVSVDGKQIGPSPADGWYTYSGCYEFQAVAPGYRPLTEKVRFKPRWYDYPPLDLFAEVLWPGRIEDVRRVRLELEPARPVRTDELLGEAEFLRDRGRSLPEPTVPDDAPKPPPLPKPPPQPGTLPHSGSTPVPLPGFSLPQQPGAQTFNR
jgi:hypothetical protein